MDVLSQFSPLTWLAIAGGALLLFGPSVATLRGMLAKVTAGFGKSEVLTSIIDSTVDIDALDFAAYQRLVDRATRHQSPENVDALRQLAVGLFAPAAAPPPGSFNA